MIEVPDWSTHYAYKWHSNPRSRTTCRTFFDKCVARPALDRAFKVMKDGGASLEAKHTAKQDIDLYTFDDNAQMAAGRTVQTFCDDILLEDKDPSVALAEAVDAMQSYKPRTWDESDAVKAEHRAAEITAVADAAITGLREALTGVNDIYGEKEVFSNLEGCQLKYFGIPDYIGRVELKTKWDRASKTAKSGWSANSLPREPDLGHLFQVAGYWHGTGQLPTLVYANRLGYRIFNSDNCEKLTPENLKEILQLCAQDCRIREKILRAAHRMGGTIEDLLQLVEPQFGHWSWDVKPQVKEIAKEIWAR